MNWKESIINLESANPTASYSDLNVHILSVSLILIAILLLTLSNIYKSFILLIAFHTNYYGSLGPRFPFRFAAAASSKRTHKP